MANVSAASSKVCRSCGHMLVGAVMYSAYDCAPAGVCRTISMSMASWLTPLSCQVNFQADPRVPRIVTAPSPTWR